MLVTLLTFCYLNFPLSSHEPFPSVLIQMKKFVFRGTPNLYRDIIRVVMHLVKKNYKMAIKLYKVT